MRVPIKITDQEWSSYEKPIVTVFSWTYNHNLFIRESIESIINQKTSFPIEIIIHDDASNDGTIEIIKEYESKYPYLFRNIINAENQMSKQKSVMHPLFEKPKGKYIALTHGDDYWTDPLKLEHQVYFLESNKEYSICFTDYIIRDENSKFHINSNLNSILKKKDVLYLNDIITYNFIPTLTVVYRNSFQKAPNNFYSLFPGDWALHIFNAQFGKIKFLNFITATYRKHDKGVVSSADPLSNYKKYYKFICDIQEILNNKKYKTTMSFYISRLNIIVLYIKHIIVYKIKKWVK